MNYLTLENIRKSYGEKLLFENLDLTINKGEKIALVAKNGSGKTTLLKVIAGIEAPEGETYKIILRKDIRMGWLPQEPDFVPSHNILDAVLESDNPQIQAVKQYKLAMLQPEKVEQMQQALAMMDDQKAWDFEAKIEEILYKLKITDFDQLVSSLSGGQQKRLALAKIIIEEPEFLILDEPTNHLDLDMIEWLEEYLQQPNLTLFMVTHDRYFLERVCNHILELDYGKIYKHPGNYSSFLENKAIRQEIEGAAFEKDKKLFKRELAWVRRQPKARGTKAKARVDSFDKLDDKIHGRRVEGEMKIDIKGQRLGKKILECHNISKAYGEKVLVKDFDYKFRKKERVGIVGPNGVGKTTFLKLLTKNIRPDSGKVVIGGNTVFGYYTQTGIQLDEDKRVIDVIQDIAEYIPLDKGAKLTAPQLLERFLFNRKQQQVYVSQLSGGERRRLYLLSVLMENPNFLILDEPTNDLDIVTLNVLEEFLLEFPGCLLIVTHDRYFMDKIVEHLFIFKGNGVIKDFNGDYSEFREMQKAEEREERSRERAEELERKEIERKAKEAATDKPKLTYAQRKELSKLEKSIAKLEARKQEISEGFNNPDLTSEQIQEMSIEIGKIDEELEEKELAWMELAELE